MSFMSLLLCGQTRILKPTK